MEKELSFESELYNVYEDNPSLENEGVQGNKSKTYSCLKLAKEETNKSTNKSTSKEEAFYINEYYGPLIIDFKRDSKHDHYLGNKRDPPKKGTHKSKKAKSGSKSSSFMSSDYSDGSCKR
jgi:hypothetical protein